MLNIIFSKNVGQINFYAYGKLIEQVRLEYEKMFKESLGMSNAKTLLVKMIDKNWILKQGDIKNSMYFLGTFENVNNENLNDFEDKILPFQVKKRGGLTHLKNFNPHVV